MKYFRELCNKRLLYFQNLTVSKDFEYLGCLDFWIILPKPSTTIIAVFVIFNGFILCFD